MAVLDPDFQASGKTYVFRKKLYILIAIPVRLLCHPSSMKVLSERGNVARRPLTIGNLNLADPPDGAGNVGHGPILIIPIGLDPTCLLRGDRVSSK
jgi:hypothetical protein